VEDFMKRRRRYVHPLSSPVHAKRSILASGKPSIKSALEHRLSSSALDHDQFIVLVLEAGPEKFAAPWRRDKD
jgi:hypothetical protein